MMSATPNLANLVDGSSTIGGSDGEGPVTDPSDVQPIVGVIPAVRVTDVPDVHVGRRAGRAPDGPRARRRAGKASRISPALLQDPRLAAVTFTGSTSVGIHLHRALADRNVRLQTEMGRENASVADSS